MLRPYISNNPFPAATATAAALESTPNFDKYFANDGFAEPLLVIRHQNALLGILEASRFDSVAQLAHEVPAGVSSCMSSHSYGSIQEDTPQQLV